MSNQMTQLSAVLSDLQAIKEHLGIVVPDKELDSPKGDPAVPFNPKSWTGDSYKGLPMSSCPPDFLDTLASTLDWCAQKEEEEGKEFNGKPSAPFTRRKARFARAWAARHRKAVVDAGTAPPLEDELGF
jgi:hypothetical protein